MSIYPVPLQVWFPNPKKHWRRYPEWAEAYHLYQAARISVELTPCYNCGKKCKWNRAWGHHSIPWGHGEIWCTEKCMRGARRIWRLKKKKANSSKRR